MRLRSAALASPNGGLLRPHDLHAAVCCPSAPAGRGAMSSTTGPAPTEHKHGWSLCIGEAVSTGGVNGRLWRSKPVVLFLATYVPAYVLTEWSRRGGCSAFSKGRFPTGLARSPPVEQRLPNGHVHPDLSAARLAALCAGGRLLRRGGVLAHRIRVWTAARCQEGQDCCGEHQVADHVSLPHGHAVSPLPHRRSRIARPPVSEAPSLYSPRSVHNRPN